jgi:hypothetical protein
MLNKQIYIDKLNTKLTHIHINDISIDFNGLTIMVTSSMWNDAVAFSFKHYLNANNSISKIIHSLLQSNEKSKIMLGLNK